MPSINEQPAITPALSSSTAKPLAIPSGRLFARVVAVAQLDDRSREGAWHVFRRYYEDVTREVFESDLAEKDHIILLCDRGDGSVQGMSTLKVYNEIVDGRRIVAIFSGDTILERAYWGQSALHWAFLGYLVRTKLARPFVPVYWFLISKGYKTYLLLSRNFPNYYPRYDAATPASEQALIDRLARQRYGGAYDAARGVLRFPQGHGRLRDNVAPLTPELLAYPDIQFFADKNPGHVHGEELCCIGRVDLAFVTTGFRRTLRRRRRK